jgi:hypothetical protein
MWKNRLADSDTQWVRTKSAFETAVFWEYGATHPRGLHPFKVTGSKIDHFLGQGGQ